MTFPVQCPICNRKLKEIPVFEVAVHVHRRTCQKCKSKWQLVVTPTKLKGIGISHSCEFTILKGE